MVPEGLSLWPPTWVSFVQQAVAHAASCVAHPWPVLATPSERWPLMCPSAPLLHPLATSQAGLPFFGTIMLSFDPACVPLKDTAARHVVCRDPGAIVS